MTRNTSHAMKVGAFTTAALLALTACGNGDDNGNGDLGAEGDGETITVAIAGEVPYSWLDDDGEPTGASVALAEEILGERMGYEVEAEYTDWDSLIPGLNANNWDAVSAGMSITPERCEEAAFSEPEIMYTTAFLVEEGNPHNVQSFEDLANAQADGDLDVVALSAGIEAGWLEEEGVEFEGVGSAEDGVDFVDGGAADVMVLTAASLNAMSEDMEGVEVTEEFAYELSAGATAFRPEDTELLEEYNEHLEELKESGELLEIIGEYGFTEVELPDPEMSADEFCEGDIEALEAQYLDEE